MGAGDPLGLDAHPVELARQTLSRGTYATQFCMSGRKKGREDEESCCELEDAVHSQCCLLTMSGM
jgi:hypothetical protein